MSAPLSYTVLSLLAPARHAIAMYLHKLSEPGRTSSHELQQGSLRPPRLATLLFETYEVSLPTGSTTQWSTCGGCCSLHRTSLGPPAEDTHTASRCTALAANSARPVTSAGEPWLQACTWNSCRFRVYSTGLVCMLSRLQYRLCLPACLWPAFSHPSSLLGACAFLSTIMVAVCISLSEKTGRNGRKMLCKKTSAWMPIVHMPYMTSCGSVLLWDLMAGRRP